MDFLALMIAIVALVLAMKAVQGIAHIQILQQQIDELNAKLDCKNQGVSQADQDMQDAVREFIKNLMNRQSK